MLIHISRYGSIPHNFIPVREQLIQRSWFDPQRGYVNLPDKQDAKIIEEDSLIVQWDINYTRDDKHGFVPTSWTSTSRDKSIRQVNVGKWSINPDVSAETFDLQFPAGTYVRDKTNNTEYILRADGSKRLVDPQERQNSASYGTLLKSDPIKK